MVEVVEEDVVVEEEEDVALDAALWVAVVVEDECQGEVRVDFRLEEVVEDDFDDEDFPDC